MILFLDFDGVLHPEPCYDDRNLFCRRAQFENILRDFPNVEIVISSSWRDTRTLEELRTFFSDDIGKRIIGVTPDWRDLQELHEVIGTYPRHIEIEGWRRHVGRIWEPWVALDDRAYWFRPFLENLVRCDPGVGLDDEIEAQLRKRLSAT